MAVQTSKRIVRKRVLIEYEWLIDAETNSEAEITATDLGEAGAAVTQVYETNWRAVRRASDPFRGDKARA